MEKSKNCYQDSKITKVSINAVFRDKFCLCLLHLHYLCVVVVTDTSCLMTNVLNSTVQTVALYYYGDVKVAEKQQENTHVNLAVFKVHKNGQTITYCENSTNRNRGRFG